MPNNLSSEPASRGRVCILDDDPAVAGIWADFLGEEGFTCTILYPSATTLSELRGGLYPMDLMITDYSMPHVSGADVSRALKSLYPAPAVIIVSGYDSTQLADRGVADLVLQKPVTLAQMLLEVSRLIP